MGLIKAAVGSVGGSLADSWLEYIKADNMDDHTVVTKGVQVSDKRSSNKRGTKNIISNGSKIEVGPNQMMILMDSGKIMDYTAEQGRYEVYLSSAPSLFNGQLKDSIKDTFNRFKFGGQPSSSQEVYFVNLQEIKGIKFGTRNALQYFDNFYNSELFLRCHGQYSVKITDPLKFFMEAIPRNAQRVQMEDINEQFNSEFLTALQAAIGQMSVDGVRISSLPSKGMELAKYLSTILDEDWNNARGLEIASVGISSISYDDESKELINMRNRGAMLSDPTIREGYVQGNIAEGMKAAGSNANGSMSGFMGVGMGMQAGGGFMQAASATNAAQMQQQAAQQAAAAQQATAANTWKCECGNENTGKFCANCGKPKPVANTWTCSCGNVNSGNFCAECGKPRPVSDEWTCSCGSVNKGKFCANCGKPRS
ncbi:MAG: SPFH domain-containing protein [Oscillospiraceae bacterium]|nr:SPFH domain-containing protein [Oscillospiraceae bacterium]MDD6085580.1 SPFH domain-containing protein [Oscillospiraceae bacterium]MDY3257505.1 SPFH domain-containing protein [Ruminococcus callidus]